MRLKEKVALITGAGSGIGRESAILFAREGARVVAVDLNEGAAQATVGEIRGAGGEAFVVVADVSRGTDAERMVGEAEKAVGALHVLFSNAGICPNEDGSVLDTP